MVHTQNKELFTPVQKARYEFLNYVTRNAVNRAPEGRFRQIKYQVSSDITGHPTALATQELLTQLMPQNVMDPTVTTTKVLYDGVKSIWRYGCLGCGVKGVYDSGKCGTCSEALADFKEEALVTYFMNLIEKAEKEEEVVQTGTKRAMNSPVKPNEQKKPPPPVSENSKNPEDVEMRNRSASMEDTTPTSKLSNASTKSVKGKAHS